MLLCPHCGAENPATARFCNACGSPLEDDAAAREVRKTVTVVFCDVVGSTSLGEQHDPEVLRGMMARFYAAMRAPVERHGGTVEKVIGDALMAVFGIPVVREDDALRAARAACEMRDAAGTLGELRVRIGVNTGDVLARDATRLESLVVGDAVNVAARIQQAAGPGEVWIGEPTWELIRHAAAATELPPVEAKGKRLPVSVWRLESVDSAAPAQRRRLELPMVGRDPERQLLEWALRRAQTLRRPHLVVVSGQAGIGKSRLVAELPQAAAGAAVLVGGCRSGSGVSSMQPLLDAIRGAVDGPDTAAGIRALMDGDPDADAAATLLAGSDAGAPDVAWAASRLLGAMTARGPVVLVIEDVHWAEQALLEAIEGLVADRRRRPLLVVCTARPEFVEERRLAGVVNAASPALEPLGAPEIRRLLEEAAPGLSAEQADGIAQAAEGNPLFAEHLAALVSDTSSTGMPPSIQLLLTARVEALPRPEQEVLAAGAVVGREFPQEALEAVLGRTAEEELEMLSRRELLEPAGAGRMRFSHALLHEASYGLTPMARRAEFHERLARWGTGRTSEDALVGEQLERAWTLRRELGQEGEELARLADEAGRRLLAAGRRADALGDPARAGRLLERALAVVPPDSPVAAAATVEMAATKWNMLERQEIERLLRDGEMLARACGERALELRARILLGGAVMQGSEDEIAGAAGEAMLTSAIAELEGLDDPRALATALCTAADIDLTTGRAGVALQRSERALTLSRDAGEDVVWPVLNLVYALLHSPVPVSDAEQRLGELAADLGMRQTVRMDIAYGQARLALLRGDVERARELHELRAAIQRDRGRTNTWRTDVLHAMIEFESGRFADAAQRFADIGDRQEKMGGLANGANAWAQSAAAALRAGDLSAARELASRSMTIADDVDDYEARVWGRVVFADLSIREGAVERALGLARDAATIADAGDWVLARADARMALARALAAAGRADDAATEGKRALALRRAKGDVPGTREAEEFLAGVAGLGETR